MFCCGYYRYLGLILYPLYADVFFIMHINKPPDFVSAKPRQVDDDDDDDGIEENKDFFHFDLVDIA